MFYPFTFYSLAALLNGIVCSTLGFFVFLKNPRHIVNKTFGLFCVFISFWSYSYFFWQISTTEKSALLWSRLLMCGAIFIPVSYLHFVFVFTGRTKKNIVRFIIILGYLISLLFFISNFTPWFIPDVRPRLNFKFWPTAGTLYTPFLIIWFIYAIYSIILLYNAYKNSIGSRKSQLSYILFGTILGYVGGTTNYFLWYDIPILPIGNWTIMFYGFFVAYAIVKYQLMNIRLILTQFFVALVGFILLINVFLSKSLNDVILSVGLFLAFCVLGYLLIKSVINEIKRREQLERLTSELNRAYSKLEELDKEKTRFMSMASHQLRAPLTVIKGYISMILEGTYGKTNGKMKEKLERVFQSNERLVKLVSDLLNVSRIEEGRIEMKFAKLNLGDLISNLMKELSIKTKEKGIYLKFEKSKEKLPEITADKDKMNEVILNILDNAIKYTEKGGITVKIKKLIEPFGEQAAKIKIAISDTGEGMTKEELSSLFQSFSRGMAGNSFHPQGMGLGLYIARRFVELQNGKIWAESEGKGRGSTFYIELPIR